MTDFGVSPGALRDAAREVDRSVDELTEVRQWLDTTELTNEDWGSSWMTDATHQAYRRTQATHRESVHTAVSQLQELAERLRASADRYERAEQASTAQE